MNMRPFLIYVLFVSILVCCLGIIKTRSGVIKSGQKMNQLQKELFRLRDINSKLKNEYRRLVTPERIIQMNRELDLSLIPAQRVICLKQEKKYLSMSEPRKTGGDDLLTDVKGGEDSKN